MAAWLVGSTVMASAGATEAGAPAPFPVGDGFVYPGRPGAEGASGYLATWDRHVRNLPAPEAGRPAALATLAWLVGTWRVSAREFDPAATIGGGVVTVESGQARIAFTPDERWLRIESSFASRWSARSIGWDRVRRRLVLADLSGPGMEYAGFAPGAGWEGDRVRFGPVALDYYGLRVRDRITLVKESADRFRIVVESEVAHGRYVAFDDMLFERVVAEQPDGD